MPTYTDIDNPAAIIKDYDGNCGPYAFAIGLIPLLRKELLNGDDTQRPLFAKLQTCINEYNVEQKDECKIKLEEFKANILAFKLNKAYIMNDGVSLLNQFNFLLRTIAVNRVIGDINVATARTDILSELSTINAKEFIDEDLDKNHETLICNLEEFLSFSEPDQKLRRREKKWNTPLMQGLLDKKDDIAWFMWWYPKKPWFFLRSPDSDEIEQRELLWQTYIMSCLYKKSETTKLLMNSSRKGYFHRLTDLELIAALSSNLTLEKGSIVGEILAVRKISKHYMLDTDLNLLGSVFGVDLLLHKYEPQSGEVIAEGIHQSKNSSKIDILHVGKHWKTYFPQSGEILRKDVLLSVENALKECEACDEKTAVLALLVEQTLLDPDFEKFLDNERYDVKTYPNHPEDFIFQPNTLYLECKDEEQQQQQKIICHVYNENISEVTSVIFTGPTCLAHVMPELNFENIPATFKSGYIIYKDAEKFKLGFYQALVDSTGVVKHDFKVLRPVSNQTRKFNSFLSEKYTETMALENKTMQLSKKDRRDIKLSTQCDLDIMSRIDSGKLTLRDKKDILYSFEKVNPSQRIQQKADFEAFQYQSFYKIFRCLIKFGNQQSAKSALSDFGIFIIKKDRRDEFCDLILDCNKLLKKINAAIDILQKQQTDVDGLTGLSQLLANDTLAKLESQRVTLQRHLENGPLSVLKAAKADIQRDYDKIENDLPQEILPPSYDEAMGQNSEIKKQIVAEITSTQKLITDKIEKRGKSWFRHMKPECETAERNILTPMQDLLTLCQTSNDLNLIISKFQTLLGKAKENTAITGHFDWYGLGVTGASKKIFETSVSVNSHRPKQ